MHEAIDSLAENLHHELQTVITHCVVTVSGWNDSPPIRRTIARYLVGLRICAIDAALSIRAEIADTDRSRLEVRQNVFAIIGENADSLSENAIRTIRNPWIAEGIWHLCLVIARQVTALHPPGVVVAVNLPHPKPSDHGIDVAVLYRAQADKERISLMLWEDRRNYFANPHYDAAQIQNWTNERPALSELAPGPQGAFLMPHAIEGFDEFFNEIAAEMRTAVLSLCTTNTPAS